jgi:transglutaminase-like putative cysteine protease
MSESLPEPEQARLLQAFSESRVGFYLGSHALKLFRLGSWQRLGPGVPLAQRSPRSVHVMLSGRLVGPNNLWLGPGNLFAASSEPLLALDHGTWVWTLETQQSVWRAAANSDLRVLLAQAVAAVQTGEAAAGPPATLPDPSILCDLAHPTIQTLAEQLRRDTPAATAEAVFHTVQRMPYRFGLWQETASRTLARGSGMCTTKANLQVALMRALGLEAGFVEVPVEIGVLGVLMPEAWRALMRSHVKHYFAAVKLGGRWHSADASFCDASLMLFSEVMDDLSGIVPPRFQEGRPYHPVSHVRGIDPFAIDVLPHLHAEMGKSSRFLPKHFEAMNTQLDQRARSALVDGSGRIGLTAATQDQGQHA